MVEAMRLVLKHPYSRQRDIPELSYAASNLTLQECLGTSLPLPRARDVFGHGDFDRQYFEFYYGELLKEAGAGPSTTAADSDAESAGGESAGDGEPEAGGKSAGGGESTEDTGSTPWHAGLGTYSDPHAVGRENAADWEADELMVETIDEHIETARQTNGWGTVAGHAKEWILATLRPRMNYRALLRQFRASILSSERHLTRMKPSRRYGFLYMGSRYAFTTRLLFAVDVSGSMANADLAKGFSVVNQLFRYGVPSIDVVQFDTELKGPPVAWKKAARKVAALGRGGTSFTPVLRFLDEHREYDGAIIFTDGCAPVPQRGSNRTTRLFWLFNSSATYAAMADRLRPLGRAAYLRESASERGGAL